MKPNYNQDSKRTSKYLYFFLSILMMTSYSSCRKLIEVETPYTQLSSENVFNDNATVIGAITSIYTNLSANGLGGNGLTSVSLLAGLSSDELVLHKSINDNKLLAYYTNQLTSITDLGIWTDAYPTIYTINAALEGLNNAKNLSPEVKQQLTGEAKFLRGFHYFYLVNLYGEVPLVLTTDYKVNALLPRSSIENVYQQIITDLRDAENLLSENYLDKTLLTSTSERVRPTKWAATAMLARVYLYHGDWAASEAEATKVINQTSLYQLEDINKVFLKNNKEAIWQLQPVSNGWNTEDARFFVIPTYGFNSFNPVYLNKNLLDSFEAGDARKLNWIGKYSDATVSPNVDYFYPFKYKSATSNNPVTEYTVVLRLAEQYLIRSEARAQQNNINGAQDDLNAVRTRAGLANTIASDKDAVLDATLHERQVELFSEWGHRWFDLKRTGKVNAVMSVVTPQKGGIWSPNWQLYPVPQIELDRDPNLTQNAGY
jgi:hypothetical protein